MTKRITQVFGSGHRQSQAYSDDGGKTWRWVCNDSVIMLDVCKDYSIPCDPQAQERAREAYVDAFLESYRKNQSPIPSQEEILEARAAHGPGKVVVDVVSGRRFTT